MSSRDLVPVPVPTPTRKSRYRLVGPLLLALGLLAAAFYLFAHRYLPQSSAAVAVSEAQPAAAPEPVPLPRLRPAVELKPPAEKSANADIPVLPPPLPKAKAVPPPSRVAAVPSPSISGPAPAQGWLLDREEHASPAADADASRALVTHVNRDIDGRDYQVLRNQSQAGCESRCKSDVRCRAYTFNKWERVCFLKSSAKVARIEPRGISGVLAMEQIRTSLRPPTIERLRSRRFPSRPYRSQKAADYDGCARACAADQSCLGFNFAKADGSCALIATLDKTALDNGTDAGMKWQAPVVASAAPRRRAVPPPRDLPPEAAIIFGVVRQMMRY